MPDCLTDLRHTALDGAWHARLALGFIDDAGTTRLTEREHFGPLRVQKALYPEGGAVCHAIIVHPPGGVVGGDQLAIVARAGAAAHALLSTPGAAKWYRANGKVSRQRVRLHIEAGASIEWMPQESIFFDHARVELEHSVTLGPGATYVGCEILCLGRRAAGESFDGGRVNQRTEIRREGRLIWWERGALAGEMLRSPFGLGGHAVCATLIAAGRTPPPALLAALRQTELGGDAGFGVTQTGDVLVARYLGDDGEAARRAMLAVWRGLRPHLLQRAAVVPRIWNT